MTEEQITIIAPRVEVHHRIRTLSKTGLVSTVAFLENIDLDEFKVRAKKMRESGDYKQVAIIRRVVTTREEVVEV